jgi:hypothetical protein
MIKPRQYIIFLGTTFEFSLLFFLSILSAYERIFVGFSGSYRRIRGHIPMSEDLWPACGAAHGQLASVSSSL